jgi:hypothetical protein
MKYTKLIFLFVVTVAVTQACRKDFTVPAVAVAAPTGTVSFDSVVLPILTANCAKSGCHVSGGQVPDLTTANAYNQLTGLGYVPQDDTVEADAKNSGLYKMITSTSKPMPPTGSLAPTQIAEILAWIKQGAQNN